MGEFWANSGEDSINLYKILPPKVAYRDSQRALEFEVRSS